MIAIIIAAIIATTIGTLVIYFNLKCNESKFWAGYTAIMWFAYMIYLAHLAELL